MTFRQQVEDALAGHYRLERELGQGGMAVVFLAEDLRHHRRVAVKVLRPDLARSLGADRFAREIAIAALLQHPHIVGLFDSGASAAGLLWYVMPHIEGESLRARLRREVQLEIGDAVSIATQVSEALDYAHRAGVVHRDIKPENILLCGDRALVADFGIARALDNSGAERLTETGLALGTPCYMSPEQATGSARGLDGRTDVYALGCVLYEMLVGEPPFNGPTPQVILARHSLDPVPSLRTARPTVPPAMETAIVRAMAKVPADRFPTAGALAAALADGAKPRPARERRLLRPRIVLGAVAVATLVLVGAGLRHRAGGLGATPATKSIRSVAVLPFANLTGDTSQMYLAAGIAEELVTALAQQGPVRVMRIDGPQATRAGTELAREYGIDALLAGSLQRSGDSIRITARLSDAANGQALWARSFDGTIGQVLSLQDRVSQSVSARLQLKGSAAPAATVRPEVDPAAFEAFVKGRYFRGKVTEADLHRAIGFFRRAIDLEPAYAAAYAGLGETYAELGYYALVSPQEAFPRAAEAIRRALELDSTSGEARATAAWVAFLYHWDFAEADREFRRALQLQPKASWIGVSHFTFLSAMSRRAESIAEAERTRELDPLSLLTQAAAARPYYNAGRYAEAVDQARRALDLDSTFSRAHFWIGLSYEQMGRKTEAIRELERTVAEASGIPVYLAALGHADAVAGRETEARRLLAELRARGKAGYVSPYDIATVLVGLGEVDSAFHQLELAAQGRAYGMVFLRVDPRFAPLEADPRYGALLRRIGL